MNKNTYILKITCFLACTILCITFILGMFFYSPKIPNIPETTGSVSEDYTINGEDGRPIKNEDGSFKTETRTAIVGKDFTAVRINDLVDVGRITKVNYIADRFAHPSDVFFDEVQIVDLTKPFEFAKSGSIIIVVMNLDPESPDFHEQADKLEKYKTDMNWRFTISLPKVFSASNVYRKSELVARNGEIKDYDFINFTTAYDKKTEKFSPQTEGINIELSFYSKRDVITNSANSSQIITIHYQSDSPTFSGLTEYPLIGEDNAVKEITSRSKNLLISFTIVAIIAFFTLFALNVIEKSGEFISATIWVFGVALLLISRYFLSSYTTDPLFFVSIWLSSTFLILIGGILAIVRNIGKFPLRYIALTITGIALVLSFICPYLPYNVARVIRLICAVIKATSAFLIFCFTVYEAFRRNNDISILKIICASLIAISLFISTLLPQVFPTQHNPMFWLCNIITTITFMSVFYVHWMTKRENLYLTNNLHLEVEQQLKDIKAVIKERDNLLQFVSHDMKKPLASSVSLLETAIEREKDEDQVKTLKIIKQNDMRVVSNLSEIGAYARFNYIAEPSQVCDLFEICKKISTFHSFDCNANGIFLKNLVDKKYNAFIKRQGLENAISSIIMNAVEHANCSTITLSAKTDRNNVILCISDNGKGIAPDMDVFKPYVTEKTESDGIGLYICKNIIESMNGTISYESKQGGTAFFITLLKA